MKPSLFLFLPMLLAACATPTSRIEANRERFETYTAEQREAIREGEIRLGFTPDMVEMALGEPDLVAERATTGGDLTVWRYHRVERRYIPHPVNVTGRGRGVWPAWIETEDTRAVEILRVEFRDGEVIAFERPTKREKFPSR